jgi:FlaA1/EpsC-like NDP-sugar epimerase
MLVKQRPWAVLLLQLGLIFFSLIFAWLLRFEFTLPLRSVLFSAFPLLALMRVAAIFRYNLLHGYWRYTGVSDAEDVIKAVAVGSSGFLVAERWVLGITNFPLSIYVIEAVLTTAALGGVRLLSRQLLQAIEQSHATGYKKQVVIVGAGDAGTMLAGELPRSGFTPVGFVDDDLRKKGIKLCGVPVLGIIDDLPKVARLYEADEILIAVPSATGRQMRRIVNLCHEARVAFRTIPGMAELINGTVTVEQLREVNFEDLLGRDTIRLATEPVRQELTGRVVMVTGAAGSIGSELCTQVLQHQPAKLLCVDQDESGLFFLQQRLQQQQQGMDCEVEYYVADIANRHRMLHILAQQGIEIIFHAAAYKHVPMMESNVREAVSNNVFGLLSLLDVAMHCGCRSFLMISSDKAVNPSSVMGCTKRIGELILAARPHGEMRCVSVRFGNVLGSQGSVVPVFQEQIRKHGRVTVTHPDITRFFMTISEAVSLVLQGFVVGKQGEILVLDMGEPMRIVEMARMLIRLLGKTEEDVEIKYTGLREGEKLYEELFYSNEQPLPTECDKVMRTRGKLARWTVLQRYLDELGGLISSSGTDAMIRSKLKQIVPEYSYRDVMSPRLPAIAVPQRALAARAAGSD